MASTMAGARLLDYKRRGTRLGNLNAAREQRAEQQRNKRQEVRTQVFLQKRTGLSENVPPEQTAQKESYANLSEAERKKRLQERLKAYREQKKALEATRKEEMKKRPPFVVPGLAYKKPDFFAVQKDSKALQPTPRPGTQQTTRVTRSQARALATNPAAPNKPLPVKKEIKKTPHPLAQKGRRVPLAVLNAPQQRKSFAPANFQFTAPVGLQNFVLPKETSVVKQLESLSLFSPVAVRKAPGHERVVDHGETQSTNAEPSDSEMIETVPEPAAAVAAAASADKKEAMPTPESDSVRSIRPLTSSSSSDTDITTPQSRRSRRVTKNTPNSSKSNSNGTPESVFSVTSPGTVESKPRDAVDSIQSVSSLASFDSDVVLPRSHISRRSKKFTPKPQASSSDDSADSKPPNSGTEELKESEECVHTTAAKPEVTVSQEDGRDISYFRNLILRESEIFDQRCGQWEDVLNDQTVRVPEDARGSVFSAVGQAKLLQKERFAQFAKLIDQCEHNSGEKEINFTDLDGFWDMIYFQVEDVHKKFARLEKLRANNWVEEVVVASRRARPKKQAAAAAGKPRPAAKSNMRALIAEARAKASQAAVASPLTPASKRLENLRRSANARSARKSIFDVKEYAISEDISAEEDQPIGGNNSLVRKQTPSSGILDESINCPVRPLSPQVSAKSSVARRRDAALDPAAPINLPLGSVLLSDRFSEHSLRRSSRLLTKGLTPVKGDREAVGTPASQARRLTRRRLE